MSKHSLFFSVAAFCLMLVSVSSSAQRYSRQDYIAKYKDWAITEMNRTGIPASITLAQGILESDCGNSDLALIANNHFGIKCHSDWTGATVHKDDDAEQECFRSYDNAYESFVDHSDFLVSKSRYSSLFSLKKTDYEAWARGLKKCGYATASDYADRLIKIIEEEGLAVYDSQELVADNSSVSDNSGSDSSSSDSSSSSGSSSNAKVRKTPTIKPSFGIDPFPVHKVFYNNGVRYIEVSSSDTFSSIAREFNMMVWELLKYNDLEQNADIRAIRFLYLRPKKNRAHPDCPTYTVLDGDTAWSIAHQFGIKLRKLLSRNGLSAGQNPPVGSVVVLR